MKKLKGLLLKFNISLAMIVVLPLLFFILTGSYAWYDNYRAAGSASNKLSSDTQYISLDEITMYTADDIIGTPNASGVFVMKNFDSILGRNDAAPVYFLIPVKGTAVSQAGSTLTFSLNCTGPLMDSESKFVDTYLSNVCQIRYLTLDLTDSDVSSLTHTSLRNDFKEANNGSATLNGLSFADYFVDPNDASTLQHPSKSSTISFSVKDFSPRKVLYVAVELNYDEELVDSILLNHTGKRTAARLDNEITLVFKPDIGAITVTASK